MPEYSGRMNTWLGSVHENKTNYGPDSQGSLVSSFELVRSLQEDAYIVTCLAQHPVVYVQATGLDVLIVRG